MRGDQADALVAALVAAFDAVVGPERLLIYATFLRDVDAEVGATAVATWIARERTFPMIVDLRTLVDKLRGTAPPDLDQAWAEVHRAMRKGRQPVRWSHEAVRVAVESLGFRELCQSTDQAIDRAHFNRAYEGARRRTSDAGVAELVQGLMPEMRALMEAPAAVAAQATRKQLAPGKKQR